MTAWRFGPSLVPGGLAALLAATGAPLAASVLLVVALGWLVAGERDRVVAGLAPALVLVLAACLVVAEVGTLLDWRPLASTGQSRAVFAGGALVVAAAGLRRDTAPALTRRPGAWRRMAAPAVPAAVLAGWGLVMQVMPAEQGLEWFLGGDHVRHLVLVAEERLTGHLDYTTSVYPRAWHTFLALAWSADGPLPAGPGFTGLARLMAAATWGVYVLLAVTTGLLTRDLAERLGLGRGAAVAALGAGATVLWPTFLAFSMALGFETSVLAALLLAVAARELVVGWGSLRAVVVTGAAAAVMAHTWQLLLPAAALAAAGAGWVHVCAGPDRRRRLAAVVGLAVAGAAVSLPGLVAVLDLGAGHAAAPGLVGPLPVVWLPAGVLAALALPVLRRRDPALALLCAMVVGTAASALVIALALGISPADYYPSKVLWHAALLGLPLAWLAVAAVLQALQRRAAERRLLLVAARAVLGGFVLLCLANPVTGLLGWWSMADGSRVLPAVTTPGAAAAQVVWLKGPVADDVIARILLDFHRVGQTRQRTPQDPLSIEQECALLRVGAAPTVLSTGDPEVVRARYSCVSGVRVLQVSFS